MLLLMTWLVTCVGYLGLTSYLFYQFRTMKQPNFALVTTVAVVVIITQAYLLHHWIDILNLQNLSLLNILSCVVWLSLVVVTITNLWQAVASMLLVIAPAGFILTCLAWFDDGLLLVNTKVNHILFWHVILAIFSIAALAAASLQAIFMYIHHRILKSKRYSRWLSFFPSVEAQGILLLFSICLCLILISLMLINGGLLLWYEPVFFNHLMPTLFLILLVWVLLAFLLLMGWLRPWHSLRIVPGIILGFVIILFAYAGWVTLVR